MTMLLCDFRCAGIIAPVKSSRIHFAGKVSPRPSRCQMKSNIYLFKKNTNENEKYQRTGTMSHNTLESAVMNCHRSKETNKINSKRFVSFRVHTEKNNVYWCLWFSFAMFF